MGHPATLSEKAKLLSENIWKNTLDYAKATDAPDDIVFLVYIWTALYYCILDIVKKNQLEFEMRKQLQEIVYRSFGNDKNNHQSLNSMLTHHHLLLNELSRKSINPHTKDGIFHIHNMSFSLAATACGVADKILPDASCNAEFMLALFNVSSFTYELFPNRNSKAKSTGKNIDYLSSPRMVALGSFLILSLFMFLVAAIGCLFSSLFDMLG